MEFPVDVLGSVRQEEEEQEQAAEGYMTQLRYVSPDKAERFTLPSHRMIRISLCNVGFVPIYGGDLKHKILALFAPEDQLTAVALFLAGQWWSVEDILRTSDPSRTGLLKVRSLGERIVLYILNRIVYRVGEMEKPEVPFLCHGQNHFAKLLWKDGHAVGFYSVKPKDSLCNGFVTQRYQLPVMDSIFVRKCHRGNSHGLQMLEDFVDSFKDDQLGLKYPLSLTMYKVCGQYLCRYPADQDLLWVVEGVGGPYQRESMASKIKALKVVLHAVTANGDHQAASLDSTDVNMEEGSDSCLDITEDVLVVNKPLKLMEALEGTPVSTRTWSSGHKKRGREEMEESEEESQPLKMNRLEKEEAEPTTTAVEGGEKEERRAGDEMEESGDAEAAVAPVEESGDAEAAMAPVEESGDAEAAVAPVEESGDTEAAVAPVEESGEAEAAVAPVEESGDAEAAVAPVDESGDAEAAVAPVEEDREESGEAEAAVAPVEEDREESGEAEAAVAPVEEDREESGEAEAAVAPVEEAKEVSGEAEAAVAPVEEVKEVSGEAEAAVAPVEVSGEAEAAVAPVEVSGEAEAAVAPVEEVKAQEAEEVKGELTDDQGEEAEEVKEGEEEEEEEEGEVAQQEPDAVLENRTTEEDVEMKEEEEDSIEAKDTVDAAAVASEELTEMEAVVEEEVEKKVPLLLVEEPASATEKTPSPAEPAPAEPSISGEVSEEAEGEPPARPEEAAATPMEEEEEEEVEGEKEEEAEKAVEEEVKSMEEAVTVDSSSKEMVGQVGVEELSYQLPEEGQNQPLGEEEAKEEVMVKEDKKIEMENVTITEVEKEEVESESSDEGKVLWRRGSGQAAPKRKSKRLSRLVMEPEEQDTEQPEVTEEEEEKATTTEEEEGAVEKSLAEEEVEKEEEEQPPVIDQRALRRKSRQVQTPKKAKGKRRSKI